MEYFPCIKYEGRKQELKERKKGERKQRIREKYSLSLD
jgi:hypothetical protein